MFVPTGALVGIRQSPAKFATAVAPYMADVAIISIFLFLFECVISLAVDDITSSLNQLFFDSSFVLLAVQKRDDNRYLSKPKAKCSLQTPLITLDLSDKGKSFCVVEKT